MFPCTHLLFVALPLSVWLDLGWTQDEEDFKIFKDSVGCEANQHWFSHYLYYWTKDNSDPDRMFYVPTSASFAACRLECLADKFCRSFVHCQPSVTSKCDSSTRCQKHRFGCPEAEVDPTRFYKKKEVGFSFYQKYREFFIFCHGFVA